MEKYDLIVLGGGISGICASVSSARRGLKVLLIEKDGVLGGAMSSSMVYPYMPYWIIDEATNEKKYLSGGIFKEINDLQNELFDENTDEVYFNPELIKYVFDKILFESGVNVLFHTMVYDVLTDNRKVKTVKAISGSKKLEFEADFFIDASGDGNLFYLAGCDYTLGRELDGLCQPMTTCFRLSGVDKELYLKDKPRIQKVYKEYQKEGKILNPRENILTIIGKIGKGIVHFNTTRIIKLDPTDPFDISKAEIKAREQVVEMYQFLKEVSPAFKDCSLISVANHIGVRESRKLRGVHILTGDELKNCTKFKDAIALGNYDLDIHNPEGSGTYIYEFKNGKYYSVPYSSLLPKEYDNLLVVGRCVSATHEAQSAIRIMPICACIGEAAGLAVSIAKQTNKNVQTIDTNLLRKKLIEQGAVL